MSKSKTPYIKLLLAGLDPLAKPVEAITNTEAFRTFLGKFIEGKEYLFYGVRVNTGEYKGESSTSLSLGVGSRFE